MHLNRFAIFFYIAVDVSRSTLDSNVWEASFNVAGRNITHPHEYSVEPQSRMWEVSRLFHHVCVALASQSTVLQIVTVLTTVEQRRLFHPKHFRSSSILIETSSIQIRKRRCQEANRTAQHNIYPCPLGFRTYSRKSLNASISFALNTS